MRVEEVVVVVGTHVLTYVCTRDHHVADKFGDFLVWLVFGKRKKCIVMGSSQRELLSRCKVSTICVCRLLRFFHMSVRYVHKYLPR